VQPRVQTQYLPQMQQKAATLDAGQRLEAAVIRLGTCARNHRRTSRFIAN